MQKNNEFIIPFSGLKIGKHVFEIVLEMPFFEKLNAFGILDGKGKALVTLEKKETMMLLDLQLNAKSRASCARCLESMEIKLKSQLSLIYKFGLGVSDDESLVIIHPDSYQIDIFQPLYELSVVSIPSRIIHKEKDCDQDIIKWLKQSETKKSKKEISKEKLDPRWEVLKNLN